MPVETNIDKITRHVASVMIDELKLEDVTPETFDPEIEVGNKLCRNHSRFAHVSKKRSRAFPEVFR